MICQILYHKKPTFREDSNITIEKIKITHQVIAVIEAHNLNDAFLKMQAENWSPNGEARLLIKALNLNHTSMSVGDVICINDDYYECGYEGWNNIK